MSGDSYYEKDAYENPLKGVLQKYVDVEKKISKDVRKATKIGWLPIAEHNEFKMREAILNVQRTCWPTLHKLTNPKNLAQLQEKVYLGLLKYQDNFNICQVHARTPSEGDECANNFVNGLKDFTPELHDILKQY